MILLGIDVNRDQNLRVTCHPEDRDMLSDALKCDRGEWLMRVVPRLIAIALATFCCGCAARVEPRSAADLDGVPIKVVKQWRNELIDAARTIFAGDAAAGRKRVIDVTRSMHAFGVDSASGNAAGLERVAADKSTPPIAEDSPDVRAVLAKAKAAIAEMEGGK